MKSLLTAFKATAVSACSFALISSLGVRTLGKEVDIIKDPLKPYTKLVLDAPGEWYTLRAWVKKGEKPKIQLYIMNSYFGENRRYTSVNVLWMDGTIKQNELIDISLDRNCSKGLSSIGSRECYLVHHLGMDISYRDWNLMSKWASSNPSGEIKMQLQSQRGLDANFALKSSDILKFNTAVISVLGGMAPSKS